MADNSKKIFIGIGTLMLAILACQPGPAPAPAMPSPVGVSNVFTVVPNSPTPAIVTATTLPTLTLEATGLPSLQPTDTLIPSPVIPLASVSVATNCRTGPGKEFDRLAVVDVGVTYEVIGKYTPDNYWIIRIPDGGQCWLWGQFTTIAGNVNGLPEMPPPPTPTFEPSPVSAPVMGAVNGVITGVEGAKVAGAIVTAQLSKQTYTTNSDGTYFIGNLPSGREFISIEDSVHKPKFQSVNIAAGATVTANFVLEFNQFDKLVATATGLVLLNSEPAAGVNVSVWAKNVSAVTDTNGRYRIEFVDEGYSFINHDTFLILAESGNLRGGVEWDPLQSGDAPDIILLPR